jgi:hypothetical protein
MNMVHYQLIIVDISVAQSSSNFRPEWVSGLAGGYPIGAKVRVKVTATQVSKHYIS